LWNKLSGGDECLLFRKADFAEPLASPAFRLLESHDAEAIRTNAKLLRYILMYPPEHVPPLDEKIANVNSLPAIKPPEVVEAKSAQINVPWEPQVVPAGGLGLPEWMHPGPMKTPQVVTKKQNISGEWPRFDQYKQALSDPLTALGNLEVRQGKLIPETKGLGTNGFVFHFRCATRHVAVKCFKSYVPDRQKRFEAIHKYIKGEARRYFLDFQYEPEGVRVGDYWYPALFMEWLTPNLNEFIGQNLRTKGRLAALSDRFETMIRAFQILGIAHGDLEPENMIIVNNDIKLIDYDAMYVPELEGLGGIERGHPAFQHPGRQATDFGPNLDYFSAWILSAELQYLKIDPQLWSQAELRTQVAVAKTSRNVNDFTFLELHPSKNVKHTGDVLRKLLDYEFDNIPPFDGRIPIYTLS
jgi:predicted Ser/Thr protein kinase